MTDIRIRLADALAAQLEIRRGTVQTWGAHIADSLLSLPGIAIVDVAVLENAERQCLDEYEHRRDSFVWAPTAAPWKHKAEGVRYAIDTIKSLAAANAAEGGSNES